MKALTAALAAALLAAVALAPQALGGSGSHYQAKAAWARLSWCPCEALNTTQTPRVEALAAIGGGRVAALLEDGTLLLITREGAGPLQGAPEGLAYLAQTAWGERPGAVLVAPPRMCGSLVYEDNETRLWLSALYSTPRPGSLWLDPATGTLWVVDADGNLYTGHPGGAWSIKAGPAAPGEPLTREVSRILVQRALDYALTQALHQHPGAAIIAMGARAMGAPRILWTGAIYNVTPGSSTPSPSMVPAAAAEEASAWVELEVGGSRVNFTVTLNSTAVLLLDLVSDEVAGAYQQWGPGAEPLPRYLVGSWNPALREGILAALVGAGGQWRLEVYAAEGAPLNASLRDSPILPRAPAPHGIVALLDPASGEPALALTDGVAVYYYRYRPQGSTLAWASQPSPQGGVEALSPWTGGLAAAGPGGLELLDYSTGEPLWGRPPGIPLPGAHLASAGWGLLEAGPGGLVAVLEPGRLVEVDIAATASGRPLGPGLTVTLTGLAGGSYSAKTDPEGVARFWVPPGRYQASTRDALLGPSSTYLTAGGLLSSATIEYNMVTVRVEVSRAPDPLGLLPRGPAAGATGYVESPWGRVEARVAQNGLLEALLPPYLSWAPGIPVRAGLEASYTMAVSLGGYEPYRGGLANVTLEPILYRVVLEARDKLTGAPVGFNVTLTLGATGRTAGIEAPNGSVTLQLPPGHYRVTLRAPGYALWAAEANVSGPTSLVAGLERLEGALDLRVVDADYGFPVNATATLRGPQGLVNVSLPNGEAVVRLPWGSYRLVVEAPGYRAYEASLRLEANATLACTVYLEPARYNATIVVRDALTGAPLGFTARAYAYTPRGRVYLGAVNATGEATLALRPWNATIVVEAPGYEPAAIPAPGPGVYVARLERLNATLEVRVVDGLFGLPVNATLRLLGPGSYRLDASAPGGRVVLSLPWGSYRILAGAPGYRVEALNATLEPGSRSTLLLRLEPVYANTSIAVADALTGKPLAFNYTIEALTPGGPLLLEAGQARGEALLALPEPWRLVLRVTSTGYKPATATIQAGSRLTLALERLEGTVVVVVRDSETGAPVPGATLELRPLYNESRAIPLRQGEEASLPWGVYTLSVRAPYYEAYTSTILVQPNKTLSVVVHLERKRVTLELVVTDHLTGEPVGFTVRAWSESSGDSVRATGNGTAVLRLRAGEEYNLVIEAPGYAPANASVGPLSAPSTLRLALERVRVVLDLVVTDSITRAPIAGARVEVASSLYNTSLTTGPGGHARILVPWGVYTLTVSAPYHATAREALRVSPVLPVLHYTIILHRPIATLKISVVDSANGQPLPATVVVWGPLGGAVRRSYNTSGTLTLALPAGVYNITARAPGHAPATASVTLNAATTLTLRLARLYSQVTVVVYDKATGALVPSVVKAFNPLYGYITVANATQGTARLALLQGMTYTITVTPLEPYYKPLTTRATIPVGNETYTLALGVTRPSYNVTLMPLSRKGKLLRGARITLSSGALKLTLPAGASAILPAGPYKALITYKGRVYATHIVINSPGIVFIQTQASAGPPYALIAGAAAAALAAGLYAGWRLAPRRPPERGEAEELPPYEELVGPR
ncbi:MAG: carboxypeptidase regulatory-like domain-containing protein [Desulfurococcales archaeon]|nr:carboxypeptidase regulatory-like domain-containing protein [Desulfurococcales archaeon]